MQPLSPGQVLSGATLSSGWIGGPELKRQGINYLKMEVPLSSFGALPEW